MLRTHDCASLGENDISKKAVLCGWISTRRDHGDIIFMDLRDKHGVTQIVFDPENNKESHEKAHDVRSEYCVKIEGAVRKRPEGTANNKIPTGRIEVLVDKMDVLSRSETPPFEIRDFENVSEETRLRYRYLDLRRPSMQKKLKLRHDMYKFIFNFLDKEGFTSVDTPFLTKSTPEGARDFLVPSRLQAGSMYALPQSPQIFKQLLMVGGLEKYFQIARCFRDEDLRADRQPEFTQLDIEMSFIDEEDILNLCERFFKDLFNVLGGVKVDIPFKRITYAEAMSLYGTDKPDLRFDLQLCDLTEEAKGSDFKIFNDLLNTGGMITGLAAPGYKDISRKDIDNLTEFVKEYGANGLAYFKAEKNGELVSPISKFFSKDKLISFREKTKAKDGDMIFMVASKKNISLAAMAALRLRIGKEIFAKEGVFDKGNFKFLWVVDFPLFKYNDEEKRWESEHHPFTFFKEEDSGFFNTGELGRIRSTSYDLVLNGSEIGSGSIRIHRKDVQEKVFEVLGINKEEAKMKFGFLLEAFSYGPPPHGGIAFGLDRLITLFTGDSSIREVIAFPKTQKGTCPLSGAPSEVDSKQLGELGLRLKK